jgi:hypothetical protein
VLSRQDAMARQRLSRLFLVNRLGFINEHDGNIILYLIEKLAIVANQPVPGIIQMNIPFAFGACQYVEQFLADRHLQSPL